MTKNTLMAAISGLALALTSVACSETATNTNTTANRNTAVVVNANGNSPVVATTNTNGKKEVTREEFDKNKDRYTKEAKDAGSKVGQGAEDLWLWTKTKTALASADDLRDSTINVDVDNAIVTLRGTVANPAQKAKAEQVAKGIDGVKSVKNTLAVKADGAATDNTKKEPSTKKS